MSHVRPSSTAAGRVSGCGRARPAGQVGWLLFSTLIVSVLTGCGAPDPAPTEAVALVRTPATAPVAPASLAAASVRGYYEARDGGVFTLCDETSRRRIDSMAAPTRAALELLQPLQQPRFIAAEGELIGSDAVRIGHFEVIGGDSWSCDSRTGGMYYAARGTDEMWSLEVDRSALRFVAGPGGPAPVLPYRRLQRVGENLLYDGDDADPPIRIGLEPGVCRELMTDSIYALQARIEFADHVYRGCAWRGDIES